MLLIVNWPISHPAPESIFLLREVFVGGVFRAYTRNPRSAERGKEGDGGNFAECKIGRVLCELVKLDAFLFR